MEARLPFILSVLRESARLHVRFLPVILVLAIVLFGAADTVDELTSLWSEQVESVNPDLIPNLGLVPFFFTSLISILLVVLSEPLFAGLVDRALHPAIEGAAPIPLRRVMIGFPYGRVIITALVFLGAVFVGILLLVLPGVAVYALLGLAVPLVVAEDLRPVAAFRRSFALLRRNVVVALLLVLLPAAVAELLGELLDEAVHELPAWGRILVDVAFSATLPAYTGVVLAVLAVWLPRRMRSA